MKITIYKSQITNKLQCPKPQITNGIIDFKDAVSGL